MAVVPGRNREEVSAAFFESVAGRAGNHRQGLHPLAVEQRRRSIWGLAGKPTGPEAPFMQAVGGRGVKITKVAVLGNPPTIDVPQPRRQSSTWSGLTEEPAGVIRQQSKGQMDWPPRTIFHQKSRCMTAKVACDGSRGLCLSGGNSGLRLTALCVSDGGYGERGTKKSEAGDSHGQSPVKADCEGDGTSMLNLRWIP
jgi:hypothetical protein